MVAMIEMSTDPPLYVQVHVGGLRSRLSHEMPGSSTAVANWLPPMPYVPDGAQ